MLNLIACSTSKINNSKSSDNKINLPRVNKVTIPGGSSSNWHYIGTDIDKNFSTEINESSIKLSRDNIYTYTDRKTIFKPSTLNYLPQQKKYKYHIANWLFDCDKKQFILLDMLTYDEFGNQLAKYDYKQNIKVKWYKIGTGTIADKEYNYICLNENRNLGY
jgi:hypothetical protein